MLTNTRLAGGILAIMGAAVLAPAIHGAPRRASVIVITLDTTRADRLPPSPDAVPLPAIARLAQDGVVFENAMSAVPLTLPAHASLFTGRLPPVHGVRMNVERLAANQPTLAGQFQAAGYRTAAFVGSVVLDADRGLDRGFEVYDGVNTHSSSGDRARLRRPADEVMDAALAWLDSTRDTPSFVWIHLYDAHAPYNVPEPFASMFVEGYDGALAVMDAQIARLVARLEDTGRLDSTGIVLAADHGESLGDHGEDSHGIFVYQSVLHVPLVVRWPGVRPARVANLVRLIDVAPTLLDLDGLAARPMDGVSLVPFLMGRPSPLLDGYGESMYPRQFGWAPLRTLYDGRYKVIEAPRPELYDLEIDPGERHNLIDALPSNAEALLARLQTFPRSSETTRDRERDEVHARLASLGYVSGARSVVTASTLLRDPKDMIAEYNRIAADRRHVLDGR